MLQLVYSYSSDGGAACMHSWASYIGTKCPVQLTYGGMLPLHNGLSVRLPNTTANQE